jgi:predicted Zn finger-like uncharacterized protein
MLATRVDCPHCRTSLITSQPLPLGQTVKCPKCGQAFTVASGERRPAQPREEITRFPAAAPAQVHIVHAPDHAHGGPPQQGPFPHPPSQGINAKVLAAVIAGSLLFLGAGIALVVFCFSDSKPADSNEERLANSGNSPDKTKSSPNKPAPDTRTDPAHADTKKEAKDDIEVRSLLSEMDQKRVAKAVDQGIQFLKAQQDGNGSWPAPLFNNAYQIGYTALPALTLLECGVAVKDERIQKAAAYVRRAASAPADNAAAGQPRGTSYTYDLALAILFLDRLGEKQDQALIQALAFRLVAGQSPTGGWTYTCPRLSAAEQQQLQSLLQAHKVDPNQPLDIKAIQPAKLILEGGQPVPEGMKKLTVWRDEPAFANPPNQRESDNSNTQFAILALWAAKRHDVPLHRTLALVVKRFRLGQDPSGSWGYTHRADIQVDRNYPTMTCAGLLGLAVGLGLTNEARAGKEKQGEARKTILQDRAIQNGFQVLAKKIGMPTGQWENQPQTNLYFLWSVERVGVIFNQRKIGGQDWYPWGAEVLVANQQADGSWKDGNFHGSHPPVNTSFALLFLKRANLARDLTSKLQLNG